jgi:hypothetical protein
MVVDKEDAKADSISRGSAPDAPPRISCNAPLTYTLRRLLSVGDDEKEPAISFDLQSVDHDSLRMAGYLLSGHAAINKSRNSRRSSLDAALLQHRWSFRPRRLPTDAGPLSFQASAFCATLFQAGHGVSWLPMCRWRRRRQYRSEARIPVGTPFHLQHASAATNLMLLHLEMANLFLDSVDANRVQETEDCSVAKGNRAHGRVATWLDGDACDERCVKVVHALGELRARLFP